MKRRSAWCAVGPALLAAVLLAGCVRGYRPHASPRIATVWGWGVTYVKDGKGYRAGMFGGGAVDVVRGYPPAVAVARSAHTRAILGFIGFLGGFGCTWHYAGKYSDGVERDPSYDLSSVDTGVLLGCAGAALIGMGLNINANIKRSDAINMYNDWVDTAMANQRPPGNSASSE